MTKWGITAKLLLILVSSVALQNEARERRVAETELLHSREFLEVARSAGGIGVFDLDLGSHVIQGSGSFFALQGIDARVGAITQDQWLALVRPDDPESLVSAFAAAVDSGGGYRAEYRIKRLDRSVRAVSSAGRVISDPSGARRIVALMMDITKRKQAELALSAGYLRARRANASAVRAGRLRDLRTSSLHTGRAASRWRG